MCLALLRKRYGELYTSGELLKSQRFLRRLPLRSYLLSNSFVFIYIIFCKINRDKTPKSMRPYRINDFVRFAPFNLP